MKAILSSTYDDKYLWNLPLVTWCWNKIGIDVICFIPSMKFKEGQDKIDLINKAIDGQSLKCDKYSFVSPEHKEATYAQCSRLYAACLDLPEHEILITSDVDMIPFVNLKKNIDLCINERNGMMTIFGVDLVPKGQFPICYVWGNVENWRKSYKYTYGKGYYDDYKVKSYQEYLDDLLGGIEADHFRGNYWCKDQEEVQSLLRYTPKFEIPRSNGQNQFAKFRYDRDDAYLLDRLSLDTIDFHLPRPGYEEKNFNIIMQVLKFHFPNENFQWLIDYNQQYKKLLQ